MKSNNYLFADATTLREIRCQLTQQRDKMQTQFHSIGATWFAFLNLTLEWVCFWPRMLQRELLSKRRHCQMRNDLGSFCLLLSIQMALFTSCNLCCLSYYKPIHGKIVVWVALKTSIVALCPKRVTRLCHCSQKGTLEVMSLWCKVMMLEQSFSVNRTSLGVEFVSLWTY